MGFSDRIGPVSIKMSVPKTGASSADNLTMELDKAGEEIRTLDINLGKVALYH